MNIQDWLKSIGFVVSTNPIKDNINKEAWYAYRKIKLNCQEDIHNPEKPQILAIYPYKFSHDMPVRFELELRGAVTENESYLVRIYGMNEKDLIDNLDKYEETLVRLWNAI